MRFLEAAFDELRDGIDTGSAKTLFGGGRIVIVLALGAGRTVQLDNLSHECFHAAHYIADACGFSFDREHDEPVAYLLGWMMDAFSRALLDRGFRLGADRWR